MHPQRLLQRFAGLLLGALAGGLLMTWPGAVAGAVLGGGVHAWARITMVMGLVWHGLGFNRRRRIYTGGLALAMGHVAKADGRITEAEVAAAGRVLSELELGEQARGRALRIVNRGKEEDAPLRTMLWLVRWSVRKDPDALARFLDYLLRVGVADGIPAERQERALAWIWKQLGVSPADLRSRLHALREGQVNRTLRPTLDHAYRLLGVSPRADWEAVRRAYRRAISRSHPDRLVSQGLSDEEIEAAGERTREIRAAYDAIRQAREM